MHNFGGRLQGSYRHENRGDDDANGLFQSSATPSSATQSSGRRNGGAARWLLLGLFVAVSTLVPFLVLAKHQLANLGSGRLEAVWGEHGVRDGQFHRPRAAAIDRHEQLYIVDKSARIQVFDPEGRFLRGWRTPAWEHGKPTGLSIHPDGSLMVADTHYFRILFYDPDGTLQAERTLGGEFGPGPGQFGLVTDAVADSQGCLYVAEYGEYDRIQKFAPDGTFLFQWGGRGSEPGQFSRPQNLAVDQQDQVWVVDACNDRVQVFDATGDQALLVQCWGSRGDQPGQLRYPYDLVLVDDAVYICEFGNHRIQKFTREGKSLQCWGMEGRGPGQLFNPWAIVMDQDQRLHIVDTYNHRVQRVRF